MSLVSKKVHINLRARIKCPHCWETFASEDVLWVATHPELINDPRLGSDKHQRFLPTRFNAEGNAIDVRGTNCQELACPSCHLTIPRELLELPPVFMSIAGTPSCGKSYYLAAMTWTLRQTLPRDFLLSFSDADPTSNSILNKYEEDQFHDPSSGRIVKLRKTEAEGDAYDIVQYGDQHITYPRPFLFTLRTMQKHPSAENANNVSRILCVYDNAGESFLPGADTVASPVTRHLSQSHAILFCFDPTQDPRFREACRGRTNDYQVTKAPVTARQETVLHELVHRVRHHSGLKQTERTQQPLIVMVTKYDAWWPLNHYERLPNPWRSVGNKGLSCLDMGLVKKVSGAIRDLLNQVTPELVSAAEEFSEQTWFIPVSATGIAPEHMGTVDGKEQWGVKPKNINPMWCEVPFLTALACTTGGLVPTCQRTANPQ